MNVFAFELRRQARSLLTDCLIVAAVAIVLLAACYPVYHDARDQVEGLLAAYPPAFLEAFGLGADVFSFAGFFQFSYLYLALCVAIAASAWGLAVFGRESRSRCESFLLAMPASRPALFAGKLAACLVCVVVLTGVAELACVGSWALVDEDVSVGRVALAALGLGGVALVFLALGMVVACFARRLRGVAGIATALGVGGFILYALPGLFDDERLAYFSPFSWFALPDMAGTGGYDLTYVGVALAVVIALATVAFVRFVRHEARVA